MSPLDPERVKQLLAKKNAPRAPRGTGTKSKKVNPNDRSHQAWFAMNHMLLDMEVTSDPLFCENPDCQDPRDKTHGQVVVRVGNTLMCRYCFIEGWLLANINPNQTSLESDTVE